MAAMAEGWQSRLVGRAGVHEAIICAFERLEDVASRYIIWGTVSGCTKPGSFGHTRGWV